MEKFNSDIKAIAEKFNLPPIFEVVANEQKYPKAKIKFLWILKETNSTTLNQEADLQEALDKLKAGKAIGKHWAKTFNHTTKVAEGIAHQTAWSDLPTEKDQAQLLDQLEEMAFINFRQVDSSSIHDKSELEKHFEVSKILLIRHIETLDPDVVIFGNSYPFFEGNLGLNQMNDFGTCQATAKRACIYISTHHPNAIPKEEDSFEDMVKAYQTYSKQIDHSGQYSAKAYPKDLALLNIKTKDTLNHLVAMKSGLLKDLNYEELAKIRAVEQKFERLLAEIERI